MYVSEICAVGIFVTFPWWLKNWKSRSKIALFSNERHFETHSQKRNQLRFSEVNYLNYTKKTQFCMWQLHFPQNKGKQQKKKKKKKKKKNSVPIPHPLNDARPITALYKALSKKIQRWISQAWWRDEWGVNNVITCAHNGACTGVTVKCIVLQRSWLHREQCNHVWTYLSPLKCSS